MARQAACWPILWLLLVAVVALVDPVSGATIRVMRDGTGDYTTIQPAIDGASPGDTILLGPGRYTEHAPFWMEKKLDTGAAWTAEVYAGVHVDSLTIMGVDRDQVIIGPEVFDPAVVDPLGVAELSAITSLKIRNMRFENIFNGLHLYGKADVSGCYFTGITNAGVAYNAIVGLMVTDCEFVANSDGVVTYTSTFGATIMNSSFVSNAYGTAFIGTSNGLIMGCSFVGNTVGVQFAQGSTGTIRDCSFNDLVVALEIEAGSSALITNNNVRGDRYCAIINAQAIATGNRFKGGDQATVALCNATGSFHGNHIIRGTGWSVRVDCPIEPPILTFDLTNNYWGTSSADSIRAWIWDHSDDPVWLYGEVDFEPFSSVPLPAEQKSLGSVKNLYR